MWQGELKNHMAQGTELLKRLRTFTQQSIRNKLNLHAPLLVVAPIRLRTDWRFRTGIIDHAPAKINLNPVRISPVHISVAFKIAPAGIQVITGGKKLPSAEIEFKC